MIILSNLYNQNKAAAKFFSKVIIYMVKYFKKKGVIRTLISILSLPVVFTFEEFIRI